MMNVLRIWDLPTRAFHWILVASVLGLVVSGNVGESWMVWHARLGYLVISLLVFRLIWGFAGGHWSRFAQFPLGLSQLWGYLRGKPLQPHYLGHPPTGAWSVVGILLLLTLQSVSGLFSTDDIFFQGPLSGWVSSDLVEALSRFHRGPGKLLILAWVLLHVLAIVWYARFKGERLLPAMLHGNKTAQAPNEPISADSSWRRVAALLLWLVILGLVFWGLSSLEAMKSYSAF